MTKKKRWLPPVWLRITLAVLLLAGAAYVLRNQLKDYTFASIMDGLRSLPPWRVAASFIITILGYLALIGHDVLGLSHLRKKVALRRTALAGFVTYAISNSAPVSFAVAGAVRFRFYNKWGLSSEDTSRLVGLTLGTYLLGMLTAMAFALTTGAYALPGFLHLPFESTEPLGLLSGALLIGYVIWSSIRGKALGAAHKEALGPTLGFTASQIAVSLADWILSGAALWVLIVHQGQSMPFGHFFGVFMLGQLAALIANLPGGIGVFDAVMITGLKSVVPPPITLAALFGYRVIYFLLPLLLALALWFGHEGKRWMRRRPGS